MMILRCVGFLPAEVVHNPSPTFFSFHFFSFYPGVFALATAWQLALPDRADGLLPKVAHGASRFEVSKPYPLCA